MQEEEKTAVTSAESSETPAPPEAGGVERSRTVLPEEPETDSSEKGEAKSKTPSEPKDKIKAIRTTLFHIAQEEEEEAVSLRVAYQIRQVKDQKEHPENTRRHRPACPRNRRRKRSGRRCWICFRSGEIREAKWCERVFSCFPRQCFWCALS